MKMLSWPKDETLLAGRPKFSCLAPNKTRLYLSY
jgi:hypothetical protein